MSPPGRGGLNGYKCGRFVENILFQTYGKVVSRLFDPHQSVGTPLSIFPETPSGPHKTTSAFPPDHLIHHIYPNELRRTQETVDFLRLTLKQEQIQHSGESANQPESQANASFHLRKFRKALESADETTLEHNPFYELSRLIFRHNLSGARNLLKNNTANLLLQAPQSIPFFEPNPRRFIPMVGNALVHSRAILVLLLTLLSILMTAIGVYTQLQPQEGIHFVNAPLLIGVLAGTLLAIPLLDFKSRLYRGMAESGGVLRGIRYAFTRQPKWMFVGLLLTLVSIRSNYDGLVALLFGTATIDQQTKQIQASIHTVLGDTASEESDSLESRVGQLEAWATWTTVVFQRTLQPNTNPKNAVAKQKNDPRYWSHYFIVNGTYAPGVNDVVHRTTNQPLAHNLDKLLEQSGVDLSHSIERKIQIILDKHKTRFIHTRAFVQEQLTIVERLLRKEGREKPASFSASQPQTPWDKFLVGIKTSNFFLAITLHQRIHEGNRILQAIRSALQTCETSYRQTVVDLNTLITRSNDLLSQTEPTLSTKDRAVRTITTPPILISLAELEPLRWHVPEARAFSQIQKELSHDFGSLWGMLLLGAILIIAAGLDVGEFLLFGALIAWRGKEDREQMTDHFHTLKTWEAAFAELGKSFFDRADVQLLFPGLAFPKEANIRYELHRVIESTQACAKDKTDQTTMEKCLVWYQGLLVPIRMADMVAYNSRTMAINTFKTQTERQLSQWVAQLLPGIILDRGMGNRSFSALYQALETGLMANQATLQERLQNALAEKSTQKTPQKWTNTWRRKDKEMQQIHSIVNTLNFYKKNIDETTRESSSTKRLHRFLIRLNHLDCFKHWGHAPSYSSQTWLKEIAQNRETFGHDLSALHDFIPNLKKTLSETLPEIQSTILDPLVDIFDRMPMRCSQANFVDIRKIQNKFKQLEALTLEMLGISQYLDPEMDKKILHTLTNKDEIDQMSRLIQGSKEREAVFSTKINHLTHELDETLQQARAVELDLGRELFKHPILIQQAGEEIYQAVMQINMHGWEARRKRPPAQKQLNLLLQNQSMIEQAPQEYQKLSLQAETLMKEPPSENGLGLLTEVTLKTQILVDNLHGILHSLEMTSQQKKGRKKSGRVSDREAYALPIELISAQGRCYRGSSADISSTGVRLIPSTAPTHLQQGETGTLRLVDDPERTAFPCRVVSFSSDFIALQLQSGVKKFEDVVAQKVMQDMEQKSPDFPQKSIPNVTVHSPQRGE